MEGYLYAHIKSDEKHQTVRRRRWYWLVSWDDEFFAICACVGDIAFRFLEYVKNADSLEDCHVTVCDINKSMLDVGKIRSERLNYDQKLIDWQVGDAEKLSQFCDNSFNAYTIAFGIRNVTHIDKVSLRIYNFFL